MSCNNCNGQMNGICNCIQTNQQTVGGLSQAGSGWLTAIQGGHAINPQGPITSPNMFPFTTTTHSAIQQGWECPRCHTINAPFVSKCECKK